MLLSNTLLQSRIACVVPCGMNFACPLWNERQIAETKERLRRAEMLEAMQSSWETYTKCDPRPDAASERALNTFLSQEADEEVSVFTECSCRTAIFFGGRCSEVLVLVLLVPVLAMAMALGVCSRSCGGACCRLLVIANVDRFLHLTGAGIGTGDGEMRLWRVNCG